MTRRLPYGSWPSPVPAEALVAGASLPTGAWAERGTIWWSENRPTEGGRTQIVRRDPDGRVHDVLPEGWNTRSRVHEYGGGDWWVHDGTVFFVRWDDQRVYRLGPRDDVPVPLTPPAPEGGTQGPQSLRHADGRVTPDGRTVICVRQRHEEDGVVLNELVRFPADGGAADDPAALRVLFHDNDFVAAPRISPDGTRLAWLTWDHPDMPWDATELWVAGLDVDATRLLQARSVAGGAGESLVQPEWGPDGALYVVSDRTHWWNVYRVDLPTSGLPPAFVDRAMLLPVHPVEAEVSGPAWVLGTSHYVVGSDGVRFTYTGADGAHLVHARDGRPAQDRPVGAASLATLRLDETAASGPRLVALAAHLDRDREVVALRLPAPDQPSEAVDGLALDVVRPGTGAALPGAARSLPRHVTFASRGGRTAHAWYYPPAGVDADGEPLAGLEGELPPLVVGVHGGPTAAADPTYTLRRQFWTTRGFALLDVDYGGSTGYGRPFRRLLDGLWGVVDVEDCAAGAHWAGEQGLADPHRLAISGGSAGGFTVLLCLATTDVFAAGCSRYGIADLRAIAADTHKFESRYTDRLVGPLPEAEAVYVERSALSHVDGFRVPLIVMQGSDDKAVPPEQAQVIVDALDARGVPHAYLLFEGEGHGWRRADTIVTSTTAELSFFGQVFGFVPAGDVPPVEIRHADRLSPGRNT